MGMERVEITDEMVRRARAKVATMPNVLCNSILGGRGSFVGCVGEEIARAIIGGTIVTTAPEMYHMDIRTTSPDEPGTDLTVEVKTKQCTSRPKLNYEGSVAAANTAQQCDAYAFVRVLVSEPGHEQRPEVGWFMGWLRREAFYARARKLAADEVNGSNSFTVKANCYNVPYGACLPWGPTPKPEVPVAQRPATAPCAHAIEAGLVDYYERHPDYRCARCYLGMP